MSHCTNINHPQIQDWAKKFNVEPEYIGAIVSLWQETSNDLEKLPSNKYILDQILKKKKGKVEVKQERQYQKGYINDNLKETEFGIRDLAARLAHRIGGTVRFESDLTKDYAGYNEGNSSVINLAKATLDTPIHEIVGHPIIRAIKGGYNKASGNKYINSEIEITKKLLNKEITKEEATELRKQRDNIEGNKTLYQSLLKELETGYGKEVLDRVKKQYPVVKHNDDEILKNLQKIALGSKPIKILNKKRTPYDTWVITALREDGSTFDWVLGLDGGVIQDEYSLEQQQEEALVQLLGELTAGKLKETKENKNLISLLKQLLQQMTAYMRSLFNSKEIEIDKLRADMTLNDLANLLAYTNSKIILPGGRVEYTTPDNQKFATYQEASNHISKLFNESKDVDLSNVKLNTEEQRKKIEEKRVILDNQLKEIEDQISEVNKELEKFVFIGEKMKNKFEFTPEYQEYLKKYNELTTKKLTPLINKEKEIFNQINDIRLEEGIFGSSGNTILNFIEKNKEFEQSKEIIETWKKENNIIYNPEEVYSRGQGFYSAIGAYSSLELDLLLQNLLQHIEDNKKAGGEFNISSFTAPVGKTLKHLGGESQVRFVIFPQSNDIKWAAPTDVYSGSVWDAAEKVSKDKKSELLGVSHTKYPSLRNVNEVSPNLASIIDERSHHHNELGIELTPTNFRLEYDETVPYEIKKLVNSVNSILDERALRDVDNFINSLEKECK